MEAPHLFEKQRVRAVAEDYRRRGYDVVEEPASEQLPSFLTGYRPDLIARRGQETVVVEVKSRKSLADEPQIRELARLLQGKPDWSFELVIVPGENPLVPAGARPFTREDVVRGVEEAERLLELGFSEAAMLRAWAAAEAAIRLIVEEEGVELGHHTLLYVLKRAVSDGAISREDYNFLLSAMESRNALAHGYSATNFDHTVVRNLIVVIKRVIEEATAARTAVPRATV